LGGEGFTAHMIATLRNNKNLLKGRKGFFRRELSYSQIREFYKASTAPLSKKEVDQELLNKIRKDLLEKQKKMAVRKLSFAIALLVLFSVLIYGFVNYRIVDHAPNEIAVLDKNPPPEYSDESSARDMINLGLKHLNEEKYFLAVGNFERAIEYHPDSTEIEVLYAEAVCLLCEDKVSFCPKANAVLGRLIKKYPENAAFVRLRDIYLNKPEGSREKWNN